MSAPEVYRGFTIRRRDRRGYLREAGGYAVWSEVQVVSARGRVLGRFDFEHQARAWIDAHPDG